jgi:Transposase DDE domain
MPLSALHIQRARTLFGGVLASTTLDAVARKTRLVRRERVVCASSLFWAFMVTLGAQRMDYISDVLRTLNAHEGWTLRYKPFWNRLAQPAFCRFMKLMFTLLCREATTRVLVGAKGSVAGYFSEIWIDDGSSFAVAHGLRGVFPGRFTKFTPAAVELHAHMSVLSGNLSSVVLAPDKEAERQFLPPARTLPRRSLSLRDRGYVDLSYFEALAEVGAFLICRTPNALNPTIARVLGGLPRRAGKKWQGKSLQQLRKSKLRRDLDLLVRWARPGDKTLELRLVIRYVSEKKSWTWLLTNVPPDFSAEAIGQLYRLRWQVELLFKDLKSYSNLRALQSENSDIVEGFIWASLCAAFMKRALAHFAQLALARPISARLAAMSGPQLLPLVAAWARGGFRPSLLRNIVFFIAHNALPTHPERLRPHDALGLRLPGSAPHPLRFWTQPVVRAAA